MVNPTDDKRYSRRRHPAPELSYPAGFKPPDRLTRQEAQAEQQQAADDVERDVPKIIHRTRQLRDIGQL
jgi:hypothetical protein